MFPRARFAVLAPALVVLLAACRDATAPGQAAPATMSVGLWGPSPIEPTLAEETGGAGRQFVYTCPVMIEVRMGGSPQVRTRLLGARWTITPPSNPGGGPAYRFTGALSRAETAGILGRPEFAGGETVITQVWTSMTFPPGPEPRGRFGMHHARWEFDYQAAGPTRTATIDVECGAALVRPRWPVVDARTGLRALYVPIRMADSTWLSDGGGEVGAHLPAGTHPYQVRGPRWASTNGTADTRSPRDEPIRVQRLAPEIEPGSYTVDCNADGTSCTGGITVYDPSGAASLPDVLPGSVRSVAVDAHRRRYDFRTSHGAMLEVSITSATGLDARYQCGMDSFSRALGCGEYAPWGLPFRLPGALR